MKKINDRIRGKGALLAGVIGLAALTGGAWAGGNGNLRPEVITPQDEINAGNVDFETLFYRGMHIYSNKFTANDHFGEAPDGPRRSRMSLAGNPNTPFLRFNGLDAQTCFECHNQIGMNSFDYMALPKEPGTIGGGGNFSANVFAFEDFENLREGAVRNAPHTFGLGYIQRLGEEMTAELLTLRDEAVAQAEQSDSHVRVELLTKGVAFGFLTAKPDGTLDLSELEGVSEDLVVRPLQMSGVQSSVRNFVTNALNFHFSVQPKELHVRGVIPDDNPNGTLQDDPLHEILEGEVSTLSIFVAALRPPMQDTEGLDTGMVAQGRALFDSTGCATCHVPSLKTDDSRVTVIDPRIITKIREKQEKSGEWVSLSDWEPHIPTQIVAPEQRSEELPAVLKYNWAKNPEKYAALAGLSRGDAADRPPGYTFDLNMLDGPDEAMPRLSENEDGTVDVPLYSDLKRHKMGDFLRDTVTGKTDIDGLTIEPDHFLTRPLWGVADTPPWLHDGRATTLEQAVLMHEGPGSEANPTIENFKALTDQEQDAVIEFLNSLRARPKAHKAEPGVKHRAGWMIR